MKLDRKKILVAGDFMLDLYTIGEVERVSPEAPVPVLRVFEQNRRPGGAGNAILNLVSLGMEVVALGRVGNDHEGSSFIEALCEEGVDTRGLLTDETFHTPLKNRMIASGQQLLRTDHESVTPLTGASLDKVVKLLPELLTDVSVVAISDYAKGFLTPALLEELIAAAISRAIPVIVDPKGIDFTRYSGATLIKPNQGEAIAAAGLGREATLDEIACAICQTISLETLMITRSKEGISLFTPEGKRSDFPAYVHEVKDVTGAGDTVLAVVTAALANQIPLPEICHLANIAAGIAIERIGCARVSPKDLESRLQQIPS